MLLTFYIVTGSVCAEDINVDTNENSTNYHSISNAVDASNSNDKIYLSDGIYSGKNNTEITIDKQLTISGKNSSNAVIDGETKNRIFNITKSGSLTLTDLTIRNGFSGYGGSIYNSGSLTLINVTIINSKGTSYGGAIYNNEGTLIIKDSSIISNTAGKQGGAFHTNYGTVSIINSILSNNTSVRGGAIYNEYGTMTIKDSIFDGNRMIQYGELGGAIKNWGPTTIINTTFTNNNGGYEGGAIYNFDVLKIINSTFINNSATFGGAIDNVRGSLNITGSLIKNNTGKTGTGIYSENTNVIIEKNSIINNTIASASPIAISNNWWGNNSGPGLLKNVNVTTWNIMTFTSNDTNMTQNKKYTLTISLNTVYNNMTKANRSDFGFVNGIGNIYSADINEYTEINNGIATIEFETLNGTEVVATFDEQSLTLPVSVYVPTNNTNRTIPNGTTPNSTTPNSTTINSTTENVTATKNIDTNKSTTTTSQSENSYEKTTQSESQNNSYPRETTSTTKSGNPIILFLLMLIIIPVNLFKKSKK